MNTKAKIKVFLKSIFLVLLFPVYLLMLVFSVPGNRDGVFQAFSQVLSLVPGKIGIYCRAAFYRLSCPDTSDDISIGFLTLLSHRDTTIEKGVYIGPQCNIGKCRIGKKTLIGSGVHVLSGSKQHNFEDINKPIQEQGGVFLVVSIGEDCWLGNCSVVMSDVGSKAIVAAGSVVTKAVTDNTIVGGNPAKIIRRRNTVVNSEAIMNVTEKQEY